MKNEVMNKYMFENEIKLIWIVNFVLIVLHLDSEPFVWIWADGCLRHGSSCQKLDNSPSTTYL